MSLDVRRDLRFPSGETTCAADVYLPSRAGARMPCVVMGHGFTGTRDLGLERYATRFAAAGIAVVAFDYRHFGTSGGEPRQWISVGEQLADWRAAIAFARRLPEVDPARVALWGTSLSGGHVIAIAAEDPTLAAVIAQVPWLGLSLGRGSPWRPSTLASLGWAALRDRLRARRGRPPLLVRVVGRPGELAVFTDDDAAAFARRFEASAPTWRDELAARSLLGLLRYRPYEAAARLAMPVLLCVAEHDRYASPALARRVASAAPHGELRTYPIQHFEAYLDAYEALARDQVAFLDRTLRAAPATRSSAQPVRG